MAEVKSRNEKGAVFVDKKTGETRTVVKTVDADSFFNVFQSRKPKTGEVAEGDSEEEN